MNKFKPCAVIISFLFQLSIFAQVQIDKQIQLTGTGNDARITGIDSVGGNGKDAVNVTSVQNGNLVYAIAGGTANALTLTLSPPITAYQAGMVINFLCNQTVTGITTLNVNSLGAKTIKKYVNQDLTGCEILNGQAVTVIYDGTNFQLPAVSPVIDSGSANAGPDQLNVASYDFTAGSVTLAGNTPANGTGLWSIISGTGGSIANPSNAASTFTGTPGNAYVLAWTVTTTCGSTSDNVNISFANYIYSSQAYTTAGGPVTFTVPTGKQQVIIECWGAQGQGGGGLGGYAKGILNISAGSQLWVYVGGEDSINGGGGGVPGHNGGGGSDVRQGGTALTNRIIVAGGGGGFGDAGTVFGGAGGGGDTCANGAGGGGGGCENLGYGSNGDSGTCTNGGAAGYTATNSGYSGGGGGGGLTSGGGGSTGGGFGGDATDGTLGQGGNHGVHITGNCPVSGAGGGGGYYGGGGSADAYCGSGGAGGGSSWASGSLTSLTFTGGVQTGDGKVAISW